jgi:hypothetical protein
VMITVGARKSHSQKCQSGESGRHYAFPPVFA